MIRPSEVADFSLLYRQNCSGCHGADGQGALAVGIGRPVYLAIADDAAIREVIERGRPGTAMPAFAQKAGGMLTDAQIDILVHGIRTRWARPGTFETQVCRPIPRHSPATPSAVTTYSRLSVLRVTALKDAAPGPSQTVRTSRWSAINTCAQ